LAEIFDCFDDPTDLVVGVRELGAVHVGLLDEELFLLPAEGVPFRQGLRPRGELRVLRHDAQSLLVGKETPWRHRAAGYNVFAIPLAAGVLAWQGILLPHLRQG
jgi:hypothetical protein